MYLKRLKLRNFKSFAGMTEVPFSPGFTGVAGPNGMGKSNISDAILFVLGPPSSKALRADRLTHLFFNGGVSKKPASECEVSLVFDNRDRALAVEDDEVTFTRYVKMAPSDPDGYYSYFYVNNRKSTQGEMETLLAHARLSGDGYNLVQQGDVNKIVAMSPLERRVVVERLAGIAQFDEDLHRAESKKEELDKNLGEIHTLLGEVTRRLGELEGQRAQALTYKKLDDERRGFETLLARVTRARLTQEVRSQEQRSQELSASLEKFKSRLVELATERTRLQEAIGSVEEEVARRGGEEAVRLKNELDQQRLALGRLGTEVDHLQEEIEKLESQRKSLQEEIQQRARELEGQSKQLTELEARLSETETAKAAHDRALKEAQEATSDSHGHVVEIRRQQLKAQQAVTAKQTAWQSAVEKVSAAKTAAETSAHDLASAEEEVRTRQTEVNDLEYQIKGLRANQRGGEKSSQELMNDLHKLTAREKALTEKVETLETDLAELNRQYYALDGRLKERMGNPGGGLQQAVDFLLAQRNLGKVDGIRGKVEDLIRYDEEYATALSVAAGNRFQALVVETDEVAARCIDLLNREKKGRVTLLPLNKMVSGRPHGKSLVVARSTGCRGFALDLVKADAELSAALWFVFGETLVMEDLSQARAQMGGVRLVTLRGELLEASGAMTGGFLGAGPRGRGNDNAAQLKHLGDQIQAKSQELTSAKKELEETAQKVTELREELAKRSAEATAHGSSLEQLERELATSRQALEAAQTRRREAGARGTEADKEVQVAEARAKALQEEVQRLQSELEELNRQYLESLPQSQAMKLKRLSEEGTQLNETHSALMAQVAGLRSTVASNRELLEAKKKEWKSLGDDEAARKKALGIKQRECEECKARLEALQGVEQTQTKATLALQKKKDGLTAALTQVAAEESGTNQKFESTNTMLTEVRVRLETLKASLAAAEEATKDLPPDAEPPQGNPEDLRKKIDELNRQISALGPVNAQALEQYDQEKTRLDEFQSEVDRLAQEKEGLNSLVAEIETKKRTRLVEVVKGADESYRQIYSELSGGGEGELVLENPEDPLQGGLLIRAKPLGKKVQRLEQLSGGEKSLASLAFIFSLQRFDPSPLYVLDEVDMSLDGVNAENIGRMLRRNSTKAQFIVISLRKVTLKWAEHLFGVTMHGDGISRVVGISLDDIKDVDEKELQSVATPPSALAAVQVGGLEGGAK